MQVVLEGLGGCALRSRSGQHGKLWEAFSKILFYEALVPGDTDKNLPDQDFPER